MEYEFKVGDRVKMAEWEEIIKGHGVDKDGYVRIFYYVFCKNDKKYCGNEYTITDKKFSDSSNEILYSLEGCGNSWFPKDVLIKKYKNIKYSPGDKVWTAINGYGTVISIDNEDCYGFYPVVVEFECSKETFTVDGKTDIDDKYTSLYFKAVPENSEFVERPKDELIEGCIYEAWDKENKKETLCVQYYSGYDEYFITFKSNVGKKNYGRSYNSWKKIT
jgi:hypothetical protein